MNDKTHPINTVGDLADYLEKEQISPEDLAGRVNISNMTLRRLLKKSRRSVLPEKYRCLLTMALQPPDSQVPPSKALQKNFGVLLSDLEASGAKCEDLTSLRKDVNGKLTMGKLGEEFKSLIGLLFKQITTKTSARSRALAIGALLYFLNPMDAIPDAAPGIGYLDDFAVLTLVASLISGKKNGNSPDSNQK